MKNLLLIILLFWIGSVSGQSVPNTTTFNLQDVTDAVYGSHGTGKNLSDCFTDSDAGKFDATYGSKTMSPKTLYGFRNYGAVCTRPSGLTTGTLYTVINSVSVTIGTICNEDSFWGDCSSFTETHVHGQSIFTTEGSDIYNGIGTDCTKLADGYYMMVGETVGATMCYWIRIWVDGGKWYYMPC